MIIKMDQDSQDISTSARRRRSSSRQRSLQSTLDKLLGIKSDENSTPDQEQSHRPPIDDRYSPISESEDTHEQIDNQNLHSPTGENRSIDLDGGRKRTEVKEDLSRDRITRRDGAAALENSSRDHLHSSGGAPSNIQQQGKEEDDDQYRLPEERIPLRDRLNSFDAAFHNPPPRGRINSLDRTMQQARNRASAPRDHLHESKDSTPRRLPSDADDSLPPPRGRLPSLTGDSHPPAPPRGRLPSLSGDHLHSSNIDLSARDRLHNDLHRSSTVNDTSRPSGGGPMDFSERDHLHSSNHNSPPPYSSPTPSYHPPPPPPIADGPSSRPKPVPRTASKGSIDRSASSSSSSSIIDRHSSASRNDHTTASSSQSPPTEAKGVAIFRRENSNSKSTETRRRSSSVGGAGGSPREIPGSSTTTLGSKERKSGNSKAAATKSIYQNSGASISMINMNNPILMRRSAYQNWLKKKSASFQEQKKREFLKKQREEEALKEKETKLREAQSTYNSWKKTKDEELGKKIRAIKKKQAERAKEEKEKQDEKLRDAEKMFQSWKNTKDDTLKTTFKQRRHSELTKVEKKKEEERQQRTDATKVFEEWKRKKDAAHKDITHLIKKAEHHQQEEHFLTQIERDIQSQRSFEMWLERKERERVDRAMLGISTSPSSPLLFSSSPQATGNLGFLNGEGNAAFLIVRPPWIPSNPTVPKTPKLGGGGRRVRRSRSAGFKL